MAVYELTLTVLSPLHIGDGGELARGFDFLVHKGRTYRLNVDAILAARGAQMRPDRAGSYPLPEQLLQPADLENPAFFRYSLAGIPRSPRADARVKSCIKDVYDCPYIPGSSLKGALRTALAWNGWSEVNPRLDRSAIGRSRSWAGQPLEHKLFGKDPNHDLLRALQVSDLLAGSRKPGHRLALVNAQVLTQRSAGSPVELEAIAGETRFQGTLKIDETLFAPAAKDELRFDSRRSWLDELFSHVQKHAQARIRKLLRWFEQAEGCAEAAKFYRQLANANLPSNQALVQLGWGAGWDSKTFGEHLQKDADLFDQLVSEFHMQKVGRGAPPRRRGEPFPRSKRAVMKVLEGRAAALAPMGWVLLEIQPS